MAGMAAAFGGGGDLVKGLPALSGRPDDAVLRDEVMKIYTLMEIARYTGLRVQAAMAAGKGPGPEVSTVHGGWSCLKGRSMIPIGNTRLRAVPYSCCHGRPRNRFTSSSTATGSSSGGCHSAQ